MKKIETLAEYQQLASRTCPDLGSTLKNELHMWSGIQTELGEALDPFKKRLAYNKPLDLVNVGEELADAMWYEMNHLRMKGFPFDEKEVNACLQYAIRDYSEDIPQNEDEKVVYTINLFRVFNEYYENGNINENIAFYMFIAHIWGLDFFQILTNNIEKLQIRYPEKFTEEAAINRDTDAERVALEKTETSEN